MEYKLVVNEFLFGEDVDDVEDLRLDGVVKIDPYDAFLRWGNEKPLIVEDFGLVGFLVEPHLAACLFKAVAERVHDDLVIEDFSADKQFLVQLVLDEHSRVDQIVREWLKFRAGQEIDGFLR